MEARKQRQIVNAVLLLDKPLGLSSNQALQKVKYLYNAKSGGHTGTLDPLASGLLPICLGEASKYSNNLLESDKTYLATIKLGETTSTDDREGSIIASSDIPLLNKQIIEETLEKFRGAQQQIPPMYSALKVAGQALYNLARAGQEIERSPRNIFIFQLDLLAFSFNTIQILVRCSKGTYIRVLARDIANSLGCCGHLFSLQRTSCGFLSLSDAINLEELEKLSIEERANKLLPLDYLLQKLPKVLINIEQQRFFSNGNPISLQENFNHGEIIRVYQQLKNVNQQSSMVDTFLGTGEWRGDPAMLWPKRILANEN